MPIKKLLTKASSLLGNVVHVKQDLKSSQREAQNQMVQIVVWMVMFDMEMVNLSLILLPLHTVAYLLFCGKLLFVFVFLFGQIYSISMHFRPIFVIFKEYLAQNKSILGHFLMVFGQK